MGFIKKNNLPIAHDCIITKKNIHTRSRSCDLKQHLAITFKVVTIYQLQSGCKFYNYKLAVANIVCYHGFKDCMVPIANIICHRKLSFQQPQLWLIIPSDCTQYHLKRYRVQILWWASIKWNTVLTTCFRRENAEVLE